MHQPAKEGYRVIAESGDSNVAGYPKAFYAEQYKGGLSIQRVKPRPTTVVRGI